MWGYSSIRMMVGETILYKYKYMHIHKYTYMTESIYGCGRSIWIMVGEDFMQIQIHTQIQIHIQIQIQIRIYDREYTWVRAQHLDDGGGGPRLLCSSYPLHCIIRCQNCPCYVHRLVYVHMDLNVTSVEEHFQQL